MDDYTTAPRIDFKDTLNDILSQVTDLVVAKMASEDDVNHRLDRIEESVAQLWYEVDQINES